MTNKLHTSLQTQEIFFSLGQSLGLQPYILSKLAIALSIILEQNKVGSGIYGIIYAAPIADVIALLLVLTLTILFFN